MLVANVQHFQHFFNNFLIYYELGKGFEGRGKTVEKDERKGNLLLKLWSSFLIIFGLVHLLNEVKSNDANLWLDTTWWTISFTHFKIKPIKMLTLMLRVIYNSSNRLSNGNNVLFLKSTTGMYWKMWKTTITSFLHYQPPAVSHELGTCKKNRFTKYLSKTLEKTNPTKCLPPSKKKETSGTALPAITTAGAMIHGRIQKREEESWQPINHLQ